MNKRIVSLRSQTGMTQSEFAKYFEIPLGSLKNWEQAHRNPPVYVINLIEKVLKYEGLIEDNVDS